MVGRELGCYIRRGVLSNRCRIEVREMVGGPGSAHVRAELSLGAEAMNGKRVVRVAGEGVLIPGRPAFGQF
jgi:hypothetical protein